MCSIGTVVFEIVDEVADKIVAHLSFVPISKVLQDVPLVYIFFLTVALSTQHLEGPELLLIRSAIVLTA